MSEAQNTIVVISAILTVAIVAAIGFVFLLLIFGIIQFRRVVMNREIAKFIDNEKNDKLRATKKDLGKMYELCKAAWDKRSEIIPIPDPNRLPDGWIMSPEGKPLHIRTQIAQSSKQILHAAAKVDPKYERKPYKTVRDLLNEMLQKNVGSMKHDDVEQYLAFYERARFGATHLSFRREDLEQFQSSLDKLLESMHCD